MDLLYTQVLCARVTHVSTLTCTCTILFIFEFDLVPSKADVLILCDEDLLGLESGILVC